MSRSAIERLPKVAAGYRSLFLLDKKLSPAAADVLADLARVCFANKTTAQANPTAMAVAEGRRQVWLHIQRQLRLTDAQIHQLTTGEIIDD